MPARRRAQEAKRVLRRMAEVEVHRSEYEGTWAVDREWAEHQAWERQRRALLADPIYQQELETQRQARRERVAASVAKALRVVEADFARWRAGDFS